MHDTWKGYIRTKHWQNTDNIGKYVDEFLCIFRIII